MTLNIYLDESGDLGWKLDKPFPKGGSSRYLVISACLVKDQYDYLPKRLIHHLYRHFKWNHHREKKWADMCPTARTYFADLATDFLKKYPSIQVCAIVVDKSQVQAHIRKDPNKLYNYMVNLLLIREIAKYCQVCLFTDQRSIKVTSGSSLHDYLQTELWFRLGAETTLITKPLDSQHSKNMQFVDMLSGVIHSHFEFQKSRGWEVLKSLVTLSDLFFEKN